MKRFRFDLEKLLELRAYREREAEEALARAVGELATIESAIREVAEERVRVAAERFAQGNTAADMRSAELYLLRMEKKKESLLEDAAKAELVVDSSREAYLEASRERKVIDKLKEKRKKEYRAESELEEINSTDDIASGSAARKALSLDGKDGFLNT